MLWIKIRKKHLEYFATIINLKVLSNVLLNAKRTNKFQANEIQEICQE